MRLRFVKMHGCGNDFILINEFAGKGKGDARGGAEAGEAVEGVEAGEAVEAVTERDVVSLREGERAEIARVMCRRRFSVGADGLIFVCEPSSEEADVRMRIFNADGSEAEMSGNGIRCFAKYVYDIGIAPKKMRVETGGGMRIAEILENAEMIDALSFTGASKNATRTEGQKAKMQRVTGGDISFVRVEMGKPEFKCVDAPFKIENLKISGDACDEVRLTVLSVGNPHAVVIVDSFDFDISDAGRKISALFASEGGVNVNFVSVIGDACDEKADEGNEGNEGNKGNKGNEGIEEKGVNEIAVRTYERGVGETLSCGTGSTASVFTLQKLGLIDARKPVRVRTEGCTLIVEIKDGVAYLTGPAEKVFEGEAELFFA